jgi:hypothetical protein
MKNFATLAALALVGCVDLTGKDSGAFDTGSSAALEFDVSWGASSVDLTIMNGDSASEYYFGIAETNDGCLNAEYGCWTGEDCYLGYDLVTTSDTLSYCHPSSSTGASLAYGGDPNALSEGSATVFSADFEGLVTFYVENYTSGECWVWGADTSYYADLGCTVVD